MLSSTSTLANAHQKKPWTTLASARPIHKNSSIIRMALEIDPHSQPLCAYVQSTIPVTQQLMKWTWSWSFLYRGPFQTSEGLWIRSVPTYIWTLGSPEVASCMQLHSITFTHDTHPTHGARREQDRVSGEQEHNPCAFVIKSCQLSIQIPNEASFPLTLPYAWPVTAAVVWSLECWMRIIDGNQVDTHTEWCLTQTSSCMQIHQSWKGNPALCIDVLGIVPAYMYACTRRLCRALFETSH